MGCLQSLRSRRSKGSSKTDTTRPEYSWEREDRAKINKENFILDTLTDQIIYRLPGSIEGQQFIVQNCQRCTIYVFDHTGQVQIDDCIDCQLFIGPIHGSIFIRDSKNCVVGTICQQFRARDCHDLHIYLSCTSQPIIESSHNIRFGCLTFSYDQLQGQYDMASISPWNNNWSDIHDFTTIPDSMNFSLLDQEESLFKHLPIPSNTQCQSLGISDSNENSITPYTYGERYRSRYQERCLVIFFHHPNADRCARALVNQLQKQNIILIGTKSYSIHQASGEKIFGQERSYQKLLSRGPVIGLEFAGDNCVSLCQQVGHQVTESLNYDINLFISSSAGEAKYQLEKFYNFASIQMSV